MMISMQVAWRDMVCDCPQKPHTQLMKVEVFGCAVGLSSCIPSGFTKAVHAVICHRT